MTPQCNPKNLCIGEPKRDKRIKVKPSIKKRKNFNQQIKVSMRVIKDNSISLLEFVFEIFEFKQKQKILLQKKKKKRNRIKQTFD